MSMVNPGVPNLDQRLAALKLLQAISHRVLKDSFQIPI